MGGSAPKLGKARPVANETAALDEPAPFADGGHSCRYREPHKIDRIMREERGRSNHQRLSPGPAKRGKLGGILVATVHGAGIHEFEIELGRDIPHRV